MQRRSGVIFDPTPNEGLTHRQLCLGKSVVNWNPHNWWVCWPHLFPEWWGSLQIQQERLICLQKETRCLPILKFKRGLNCLMLVREDLDEILVDQGKTTTPGLIWTSWRAWVVVHMYTAIAGWSMAIFNYWRVVRAQVWKYHCRQLSYEVMGPC